MDCHACLAQRHHVPKPVVLYVFLSLLDFGFTIGAFVLGASEANPALQWFKGHGLFEFVKLSATLLVCCVGYLMWRHRPIRRVITIGNAIMLCVVLYHSYLWYRMPFQY